MLSRIRAFFSKSRHDRELDDELESHLSMSVEAHIRQGMTEDEAHRAALVELGAITQLKEEHRERRGLPFLDTTIQDLRYTFRTLEKDTAFTTFAILIAALGIGSSVIIFNVVNALLLRPMPFAESSRLAWIGNIADDGVSEWNTQVLHVVDLGEQSKSFSGLAAYFAYGKAGDNKLTREGEPVLLDGVSVSSNFFRLLGVKPLLGRVFTEEECKWNGPNVVLLSYGLWTNRFASDPAIVGRQLTINESLVTVVGVMPASFDFGSVFAPGSHVDLFNPFPMTPETNRWGNTLAVIGRLQPGVTIQSAQAELTVLAANITKQHPERNSLRPRVHTLDDHVNGRFRAALLVLAGAVGVVMLIVCANLANLQIARSASRQKEMAIRIALGAGRSRLIRQMLTESLVLVFFGSVPGLMLAIAGTRIFAHLDGFKIPLLNSIRIDGAALGFTIAVTLLTGLAFGLLAAFQAPTGGVHATLKDGNRGSAGSKGHNWTRGALVVTEIAFACVLLVGTGLLVRSFLRVLDVDLGFRPDRVTSLRIDPTGKYANPVERTLYVAAVLRAVRSTPGITAAGITDTLPLSAIERSWAVSGKGQIFNKGHYPEAFVRVVTEGFLQSAGVPLIAGRDFSERDTTSSEPVAMVNQTLARTLWPGQNPIGQILDQDGGRRVIGVVADMRHRAIEETSGCEMYLPMRQTEGYYGIYLLVSTALAPADLSATIRAALKPIEPNVAANEFRTLQQMVDKAASPRRFVVLLLSGFSLFALALAALGIYALISYAVTQRTQEFGIRMALGAGAFDLQSRVLLQTLGLAGTGVLIGLAASSLLARALSGLLFGVTSADPLTFAAMVAVLGIVAALAGYLPARRASRIDPMIALRGG